MEQKLATPGCGGDVAPRDGKPRRRNTANLLDAQYKLLVPKMLKNQDRVERSDLGKAGPRMDRRVAVLVFWTDDVLHERTSLTLLDVMLCQHN